VKMRKLFRPVHHGLSHYEALADKKVAAMFTPDRSIAIGSVLPAPGSITSDQLANGIQMG
jgi:hypothetical protein